MNFTEVTREQISERRYSKAPNKELKEELNKFISLGYQYARVDDTEGHYNNNNDLRRAIQTCIIKNDLPIAVFMYKGITYLERL